MPGLGLFTYEGGATVFGEIPPRGCVGFPLLDENNDFEKVAYVHCLPSDQALDLYVFEIAGDPDAIYNSPYDLFDERSRALRVNFGTKRTHEVLMNNGGAVRFLLAHTINLHSHSLS